MKMLKKTLNLALALLLILNALCLSVFADEATTALVGNPAGAVEGSVYPVTLHVEDLAVGGASGVITYDTAKFEFKDVTMPRSMAEKNRLTATGDNVTVAGDIIKLDAEAGTITFALVADGANTDWVVFNFLVKTVSQAVSETDFTLSGVKVSNATGTAAVETVTLKHAEGVTVADAALTMHGSTVRTNGEYDLRYEITISKDFLGKENIRKVGMILIPTSLVAEGKELLNDTTGKSFCVAGAKPNIAVADYTIDADDATTNANGDYTLYVNILKSGVTHMNREYSLRAFVELEDGTVVYCDNEDADKNIVNGTASRSCKSTAIAIYNVYKHNYDYSAEVEAIIAKTANWTAEDYQTVAAANVAALQAQ